MFFHSFPRPKRGQDSIQKGLKILENFLKNGILLVPEILTYEREKDAIRETPQKYHIVQRRFCMTEIDISELKAHEKHFGPFHIEFTTEDAYALGAMPVFYLPRTNPNTSDYSLKKLAASCIYELYELQYLCENIQLLSEMVKNKPDHERVTVEGENAIKKKQKYSFDVKQLRDVLDMLTMKMIPNNAVTDEQRTDISSRMNNTLGVLKGIGSLFYPTDKDFGGEHEDLYNFRQREWRIIGGISIDGKPIDRGLNNKEKDFLLSLDPKFYERKMHYANNNMEQQKAVDGCTIMPAVIYEVKPNPWDEKAEKIIVSTPVQKLVERIIVPKEALKDARKIAKNSSFDCSRIVDFETAMELAALEHENEIAKKQSRIRQIRSAKTWTGSKGNLMTP